MADIFAQDEQTRRTALLKRFPEYVVDSIGVRKFSRIKYTCARNFHNRQSELAGNRGITWGTWFNEKFSEDLSDYIARCRAALADFERMKAA